MIRNRSLDDRRTAIDDHLETILDAVPGTYLAPARTAVLERDDRWYGQLAALSYAAAAETPTDESALRAATAMELLRGYYRLRSRLLARFDATTGDPNSWDSNANAALLASDYLYTAAYSRFGDRDGAATATAVGTLAAVSETTIETLASAEFGSSPSPAEYASFVAGTAGAIGGGAARIGATVGSVDASHARQYATIGRTFSTWRRIHRRLEDDATLPLVPTPADERALRQRARGRLEDGRRALESLSTAVDDDIDPLVAFLEDRLSEAEPSLDPALG